MPTAWTVAQVSALSPDASSLKAAQKLLDVSKWSKLGQSPPALWGECQGSGKTPYLTRIDLNEPAFKCSCPSRKFPCKHALALFTLYLQDASAFAESEPPAWVSEWLASRTSRKEAKEQKADAPGDEKAQAKRVEAREKKVEAGLAELQLWLHDLLRTGLRQLPSRPFDDFGTMAARLVDAQAPGLARLVRELNSVSFVGESWVTEALAKLGQLQVIISAYERQAELPEPVQADLRRVVGWTDSQQDLSAREGSRDTWLVVAQNFGEEGNLRVRKSWLWGQRTGQVALILEFSYGATPFETTLLTGQKFEGELVFYPSNYPLRAALKEIIDMSSLTADDLNKLTPHADFDALLAAYAEALAANCWLEQFPVLLQNITPFMFDGVFGVRDGDRKILPVSPTFKKAWQLMALSGGEPLTLAAEWDGASLLPLSVWQNELVMLGGPG